MKISVPRLRFFIPILLITITLIVGGVAYAVTLAISSVGEMQDNATKELDGPRPVAITTIGDSWYAVVAGYNDAGIEIIDISDPTDPTSVGKLQDAGTKELAGAGGVAITMIGGGARHMRLWQPVLTPDKVSWLRKTFSPFVNGTWKATFPRELLAQDALNVDPL